MTQLMQQAIAAATKLPDTEQDEIAAIVLREIEAERHWDELFAKPESHELLARLADQALAAHRAGRSRKLDVSDL